MKDQPEKYDLIVIGGGPAGEKGASKAAYYGKHVALVEREPYLGGAGINTGTVPSKTLRESALYYSGLQQRGLYGIDYSFKKNLSIKNFMHRERIVVDNERQIIEKTIKRHNITVIQGEGSLKDSHTVHVKSPNSEIDLSGEIILIATGSSPRRPAEIPFDGKLIFDSDTILDMNRIPRTMVVVGGGVIGTEYASIFTALGIQVTLIEPRDRIVPFLDSEIATRLMDQLTKLGLKFIFNDRMTSIEPKADHVQVTLEKGGIMDFEVALVAAGRQSNVEGLGLEQVGVKTGERGLILVDENFQTNIPNIFAVGDVIGFPALASTSMEQARAAIVHAFHLEYKEKLAPFLPLAIYAIPEVSSVGLTEDECKAKNTPYLIGRAYYEENARGQIIGDLGGMIKLVFSPEDKKLLGAHIIGEQASELIHMASHVMLSHGAIDAFIEAVYNYPTLSDSYQYAAYDGLKNHDIWLESTKNGIRSS
ncbi:MAG TPA: Si-specific NAD(P)(+) transhydrogenase [Anaerolineales bacterium]|nr:Si-specific NAD(P)(+) transhydrogenase [Anaerolineales bacterium]